MTPRSTTKTRAILINKPPARIHPPVCPPVVELANNPTSRRGRPGSRIREHGLVHHL
jgi:hypothetical protein